MKRVKIKSDQINFIGSWNLENNDLCKNIINFFESHKEMQIQGLTDGGGKDTSIKKTTDISIDPNDLKSKEYSVLKDYIEELFKCFNDYQNQWPFLKKEIKTVDISRFNIQKYLPGDHFAKIHSERTSTNNIHRIPCLSAFLKKLKCFGSSFLKISFTSSNINSHLS